MKTGICPACSGSEIRRRLVSVLLKRGEAEQMFNKVPALVCNYCGEEFIDETTAEILLSTAEQDLVQGKAP